jgi:hypothetical protein
MQASGTPLPIPPDDVLVALFEFALAAAGRFWAGLHTIQVGLGTPYTYQPPSAEVLRRFQQVAKASNPGLRREVLPCRPALSSPGEMLLGMDVVPTQNERHNSPSRHAAPQQWHALVWMAYRPYRQNFRQSLHARLTVSSVRVRGSRDGGTAGAMDWRVEIGTEKPRPPLTPDSLVMGGWTVEDHLLPLLLPDSATPLCHALYPLQLVHPVKDAILMVYQKQGGSVFMARWDRRTGIFHERQVTPPQKTQDLAMVVGSFSLSPSGRYLSWWELLVEPTDDVPCRRIVDLARPQGTPFSDTSLTVRLPDHFNPIHRAIWLSDEEWIEVYDVRRRKGYSPDNVGDSRNPRKGNGHIYEWAIYNIADARSGKPEQQTGRPLVMAPLPPGQADSHLFPVGYRRKTRQILAFDNLNPEKRLVTVHRDTGEVHFVPMDRHARQVFQEADVYPSPTADGETVLWWVKRPGRVDEPPARVFPQPLVKEKPVDTFLDMSFYRSDQDWADSPLLHIRQMYPDAERASLVQVAPYPLISGCLDVNGDLLLWANSLWVYPQKRKR